MQRPSPTKHFLFFHCLLDRGHFTTASMVLGIISIVCWFFGWSLIASVILGVVGLILSSNAKKAGFVGGMQTAGFVLSLIGLIGGGVFLISCIACVGAVGGVAGLADIANSLN